MSIETINFNGTDYPALQSKGFASKFAFQFAKEICKGVGLDIGYCKPEWKFPGASGLDHEKTCNIHGEEMESCFTADDFFAIDLDFCYSSHCLEHLNDWVGHLDYWSEKMKHGANLFLYLPNCDYQEYWAPASNRKHVNHLNPLVLNAYFEHRKQLWKNVFVTEGYDLNGSFYAIAEKV